MVNRLVLGLALLAATGTSPARDDYTFCELTNEVAGAGKLRSYSNRQIENGLCMTSKEAVDAIAKDDAYKQRICLRATQYMMAEFKRRFPSRSPKEVIGRC